MAERDVHGDAEMSESEMERAGDRRLMAKTKPVENKTLAISLLKENARNYNRHSESQLADLRASLQQFGQVRSVVVQANGGKSYTILAGHGIIEAARQEGYTELRADVVPATWSKTKALAYLAADNELARHGDPDQDQLAAIVKEVMDAEGAALARLAAGEQSALDALLVRANPKEETADVGALVDKAAELQKKWKVERGDVWEIGKHRLMCGDSTSAEDVATLMGGDIAGFGFHDPPYGYNYQSNMRVKSKKFDVLQNDDGILLGFIPIVETVSKGWVLICTSWKVFAEWVQACAVFGELQNVIIWDKGGGGIGDLESSLSTDYEMVLAYNRGESIKGKRIGSVWSIGKEAASTYAHATQKPTELITTAIQSFSMVGEIVLDLFIGSGTTLVACEQTGRIGRGMEISEKYCAVTLERLSLLGLTPVRNVDGATVNS